MKDDIGLHELLNRVPNTFKNWDHKQTIRYFEDLGKLQKLASSAQKNKQKIDAAADNVRRYFY
jgi:hypothetical protein